MLITEYNEQKEFAKERQEGSSERAIRMAITMIKNGEPDSKIVLYTELPESEVSSLRKSVGQKEPAMA